MRAPLIPVVFSFIAGILTGYRFEIPSGLVLTILSILLALTLFFFVNRTRVPAVLCLCLTLLFSGILSINGCLRESPGPLHISRLDHSGPVGLEGVLLDNPVRKPDTTDLVLEAVRVVQNGVGVPVNGRVLLSVNETGNGDIPRYGDLIRVKVKLRRPQNFNNPGGFDYQRYLRLKGIFVRGFVEDTNRIVVIRSGLGNPLTAGIEGFRDRLRALIRQHSPPVEGTILQAMVLGEQNEIPREVLAKFNRTGTTHILAISGFNIGIIFIFFLLGIKTLIRQSEYLLLRFDLYKIACFLAAIPVIFYTYVAGLGMSVIRAAIMILALVIAGVSGRQRDLPNTLALAALVMVAVHPTAFFDVSFQLSFAAVAGILFIVPRFSGLIATGPADPLHKPGALHKTARAILIFILVTASATLATIPLTTYYFNTFSLIVILSNIILVPILGYAVIFLGIGILISAPAWNSLAVLLVDAASFLIRISIAVTDRLSSLSYASVYTTTPTLLELTAFYLLLVASVLAVDLYLIRREPDRGWRFVLTLSAVVLLASYFSIDFACSRISERLRDRLSVTFIDVGQGSSALVTLPHGKNMIIDGGGLHGDRFDIGQNVVAPFLWHEKIRTIDTLVLSHPHPDHLKGLLFILRNFSVREVWSNGKGIEDDTYAEFRRIIEQNGIKHRALGSGEVLNLSGVSVRALNPARSGETSPSDSSDEDINDDSLVLKFTYRRVGLLFPGDISEQVEARLVRRQRGLESHVLLAPHHGSRFSNSARFIQAVHPETVIFSCGRNNPFRLPNPEVVKRYESAGSRILRTDRDGAITIETDGFRTFTRSFLIGS